MLAALGMVEQLPEAGLPPAHVGVTAGPVVVQGGDYFGRTVNLAVHDAVAAANLLVRPLRDGTLSTRHLARVQLRRLLPTVVVQWGQRTIQDRFLSPVLAGRVPARGPLVLRALRRFPVLQAVPARLVGIGILPEHVRVPAAGDASAPGVSRYAGRPPAAAPDGRTP